ncbi:uncharacterized protein AAHN32_006884 [Aegotheles albertisi]
MTWEDKSIILNVPRFILLSMTPYGLGYPFAKLERREERQIDGHETHPPRQQKVPAEEQQWPENMPEWEERKSLLAQRRVESVRLLTVLLNRVKGRSSPALNAVHTRTASAGGCCKKQKVYETDEFIHYLLNYYQTPGYARVCLEPKKTANKSWWKRVVCDDGGII